MPELPEVETIRMALEKYLIGHKILAIDIKTFKVFSGVKKNLLDAIIVKVRRFAKVLSIDLSNKYSILIHVKLTGQPIYRGPNLKNPPKLSKKVSGGLPGKHTHIIFKLDKNGFLYYNDVRKFGWIKVIKTKDVESSEFIGKLGPEPFKDLTFEKFVKIISKSKTKIKILLMNQEKISGIGNIYANDALWLSKISPKKISNKLKLKEKKDLYNAILKVLKEGIKRGGASELSFVTPDGTEGNYQKHFLVYAQEEKICPRCRKEKIQKIKLGGRGTYFCSNCQKVS
ncbi:bifunctional DNA-formamidopyrimidine glycosylase/DNA-(apurinic or apyrimidinic site) lyase [Patescibacteria group bacterium]